MIVDKDKTYRILAGNEVRIYVTDGGGDFPVHGAVKRNGVWFPESWTAEGRHSLRGASVDFDDLVEVRPRHKREIWMNEYLDGNLTVHKSRERADHCATLRPRLACLHHTFGFEEGEGL